MNNRTKSQKSFAIYQSNRFLIFCILGIVGFLIYSNALLSDFQFDDYWTIVNNHAIRNLSNPSMMWDYFQTRIITGVTFAINYFFFKLNTFSYHIINVLIHVINAFLVFTLTKIICSSPRNDNFPESQNKYLISLIAAFIFLVHPIQTSAVTYITQRFSLLSTFFYLSTVICYLKARLNSRNVFYVLSLIATYLAMFTKELAFTIPITLILCEVYFIQRSSFKEKVFKLVPFLVSFIIIPISIFLSNTDLASIKLDQQLSA